MENLDYSRDFSKEFIRAIGGKDKLNYELNYCIPLAKEVFGNKIDISKPKEFIFAEDDLGDDEEPSYIISIKIRVPRRSCFRLRKYRNIFLDRLATGIPGNNLAVLVYR